MAWIESHQALGHHPKTQALGSTLRCGLPTAVGYLHFLWWWALDYAQGGGIPASELKVAARACQWRGEPTRFWDALQKAGFVEFERDGSVTIHDWMEYAGRLVDRRKKDAERKRDVRGRVHGRPSDAAQDVRRSRARDTTNPTNHVVVGVKEAPGPRAHDPGPGGPVTRAEVVDVGTGAQQCPICRQVFTGTYLEHTAEKHKIREHPEDFRGRRGAVPYAGQLLPEVPNGPLVPTDELVAEHERLLAKDRANGT